MITASVMKELTGLLWNHYRNFSELDFNITPPMGDSGSSQQSNS